MTRKPSLSKKHFLPSTAPVAQERRVGTTLCESALYLPNKCLALLAATICLMVVLPTILLPYGGDDVANHLISSLSYTETLHQAIAVNSWWIHDQGRFFPTAQVYGALVWHVFPTVLSYHTWIAGLLTFLLTLVSVATYKMTKNSIVTIVVLLMAASGLQFRYWTVDGVANMGGLVTLAAILAIMGCLFSRRYSQTGHIGFACLASALWFMAITTYEITLLMLPALLVLTCIGERVSRRSFLMTSAPLLIATALDLVVVAYVRTHVNVSTLQPEWATNWHGPVLDTTMQQFLAALPSSQFYLGGASGIAYPWLVGAIITLVIGVPLTVAGFTRSYCSPPIRSAGKTSMALALSGVWIWLVPSIMVGTNGRWQNDLPVGQGYIYTFYASIGLALIVGGIVVFLLSLRTKWDRSLLATSVLFVAIFFAAGTAAVNLVYSGFLS
jgi:hypothetical protein